MLILLSWSCSLHFSSTPLTPTEQGPLVSERISSSAITTEYANGDPVYQTKTAV